MTEDRNQMTEDRNQMTEDAELTMEREVWHGEALGLCADGLELGGKKAESSRLKAERKC
jgi:hypothetical protein